jgi:hypothetical protein
LGLRIYGRMRPIWSPPDGDTSPGKSAKIVIFDVF